MQNIEIVDPIGFEIEGKLLKNGQWKLKLQSMFKEEDRDAAENTLVSLKAQGDGKTRIVENTMIYTLTASRSVVMNTLALEFLNWSDFSGLTIDEVIVELSQSPSPLEMRKEIAGNENS